MKFRPVATLAALALAAGLAACATPTPYQPAMRGTSVSGGFSELRISDNRFRVTFSGNTLTSRETVERYLLYRAAEVTTQAGYDWFEMVDRNVDRDQRTYVQPNMMGYGAFGGPGFGPGFGYWSPSWRMYGPRYGWRTWDPYWGGPWGGPWGGGWGGGGYDVRTVEKFEATADIMLRRGPTPEDNPRAFDARQMMTNLGPTVQRPVPKS